MLLVSATATAGFITRDPDAAGPTAEITTPAEAERVTAPTAIIGTADRSDPAGWHLNLSCHAC